MINLAALKSAAPLHEIVAEHVRLARRGKTLWGCCPFHAEKTASLAVHPEYFHCHGCHVGGDVIDFTARINHTTKGRAIRILAERYGVPEGARQSRAESQYMSDLRVQAEFWWATRRAVSLTALESACARFFADQTPRNEELAIRAGQHLRMVDAITPAIRGRVFLALRTEHDNKTYRSARDAAQKYLKEHDGLLVTDWLHEMLDHRSARAGGDDPADFILKNGTAEFLKNCELAWGVPMDILESEAEMKKLA